MIGRLQGRLLSKPSEGMVILDVGGVGFEVHVPPRAAAAAEGSDLVLHVATIVRDDDISPFGFPTRGHLVAFRLLMKVKNVGPKLAMSVMASMEPEEIAYALSHGDVQRFRAVPGVGPKTAQLIVVELRDQVKKIEKEAPASPQGPGGRLGEVATALEHLGFRPARAQEAALAVRDAEQAGADLQSLIKEALKKLA